MDNYCNIQKNRKEVKIFVNVGNDELDKFLTENTIKQISKITKKYSNEMNIKIITDLDLDSYYKDDNLRWSIVASLKVAKIKDKTERLYKIYEYACKFLDNEFQNKNLCEFENDICLEKKCTTRKNGCCYTYKHKFFGILLEGYPKYLCEYQKDKHCTTECLGCKLFVCDAIKNKRGINFTTNNIPLIKYYFNIIQKIILKAKVFTHKDKVLKLLKIFNF